MARVPMALTEHCSICSSSFTVQFRYQTEEIVEAEADGRPRVRFAYYCSQQCLDRSHAGDGGSTACDACSTSFVVELAAQVLYLDGHRRYACGPECRQQLLAEARGVRLGEGFVPTALPAPPAPPGLTSAEVPRVLDPAHAGAPRRAPQLDVGPLRPAPAPPRPSPQHPQVLAVFNHKGGTGKTTSAVTVAAGLAARGQRVLLVDTDGQGNVGVSLALEPKRSLYHVLVMGLALEEAVQPCDAGFDVLPANETLAAAELYLAGRKNRDRVLASRLEPARRRYDTIIVDCSPSLSLMNQNALVSADAVLCPVACDYLSLVGVRQVVKTIKQVNKLLGHPVGLWGVLPTMFDARARICHEALDTLRSHFAERCLDPIRAAIKVKEAPAQGKTLFDYAPGSSVASDYARVVDRLVQAQQQMSAAPRSALVGGAR